MTILEAVLIVLVIAAAVIIPLAIAGILGDRRLRRTIAFMRTLACPHCQRTYGAEARLRIANSFWDPAPGFRVSQLDLPDPSYFVTCPQCAEETEHRKDGRVFKMPEEGIGGRTILFESR